MQANLALDNWLLLQPSEPYAAVPKSFFLFSSCLSQAVDVSHAQDPWCLWCCLFAAAVPRVDIWDVPDAEQAQQPLWCGYRRGLTDKYELDRCAAAAAAAVLQHQQWHRQLQPPLLQGGIYADGLDRKSAAAVV
jgi:hypothetical protein